MALVGQQLVWEWGRWKAIAIAMRPWEQPVSDAWLVLIDDLGPNPAPLRLPPSLARQVQAARAANLEQAQRLTAPDGSWAGVIYVPSRHGELFPLAPLRETLAVPDTMIVVDASEALRLEVAPQVLAAWLRGGLKSGGGMVILAAGSERDLATLHTWAGRAPKKALRQTLEATAKVAGLGAVAAMGVAAAAWVDRKVLDVRAKDMRGLGAFRPRGTTAVSRLAEILLEELPEDRRDRLVRTARGRTKRGDPLAVLEEWLHEHPDPARVLASQFAPYELAVLARKHLELDLSGLTDGREMAEQVLSGLGFSTEEEERGLHAALCEVTATRALLMEGRIPPHHVGSLGTTLERVIKCLLSFHLRLAFDSRKPRDELFKRVMRPDSTVTHRLDQRTLGELLHALEDFEAWRTRGKEREARARHAELFTGRRTDRAGLKELVELRNLFSHDRPGVDRKTLAPAFLDKCEAWLGHLREDVDGLRLFPALVYVESAAVDAPGYRIEGVDDEGRKETLRLRKPLVVGTSWYMLPRSNPERVRPILVPAD